jgi:hypothetical protein
MTEAILILMLQINADYKITMFNEITGYGRTNATIASCNQYCTQFT